MHHARDDTDEDDPALFVELAQSLYAWPPCSAVFRQRLDEVAAELLAMAGAAAIEGGPIS